MGPSRAGRRRRHPDRTDAVGLPPGLAALPPPDDVRLPGMSLAGGNDCGGCGAGTGALVASAACRERFELVLAREFSDPAYFAVHHLTVAAYRLQHPDDGSGRTLAALLTALGGGDVDGPTLRRRMRWAVAQPAGERPPTPAYRGEMTIGDVVAARSADEHCAIVRHWAEQVRAAWARPHP